MCLTRRKKKPNVQETRKPNKTHRTSVKHMIQRTEEQKQHKPLEGSNHGQELLS